LEPAETGDVLDFGAAHRDYYHHLSARRSASRTSMAVSWPPYGYDVIAYGSARFTRFSWFG